MILVVGGNVVAAFTYDVVVVVFSVVPVCYTKLRPV